MTLTNIIDKVTEWAQTTICDKLSLKLPDDDQNGDMFPGTTTTPAAFPLFVPAKDRLPPKANAPIPSICVQIKEGKDILTDGARTLKMRFSLATWNPGSHGSQYADPAERSGTLGGKVYQRRSDPETINQYTRNMDGWRDLWNFADKTLQALEGTEYIEGLRLVKDGDGITFGPFTEDGTIWDYYPYWFMWIDFTLECGASHKEPEIYKNLL
jgi:hypothetical protein